MVMIRDKRARARLSKGFLQTSLVGILLTSQLLPACGSTASPALPSIGAGAPSTPDWFKTAMTDVRTGKPFTVNDFAGKVVLIETIAQWCPNCLFQQGETRNLQRQLGKPEDLILISLDVDVHEDEASLKKYAAEFGFDWRFAVAPLEVARAIGNLYSAEYLNPPLDPMLLIDRQGNVYQLPYGMKKADTLQKTLEPYLAKR
jgi:cytochrome oxidase Cu insertion factor (SCO1/SenC/PrrC family)